MSALFVKYFLYVRSLSVCKRLNLYILPYVCQTQSVSLYVYCQSKLPYVCLFVKKYMSVKDGLLFHETFFCLLSIKLYFVILSSFRKRLPYFCLSVSENYMSAKDCLYFRQTVFCLTNVVCNLSFDCFDCLMTVFFVKYCLSKVVRKTDFCLSNLVCNVCVFFQTSITLCLIVCQILYVCL